MPTASSRIPVFAETHERLKDFARGLDATQDEAINYLLHVITDAELLKLLIDMKPADKKSAWNLGRKLREEYKKSRE